jgi:hypothetical protein
MVTLLSGSENSSISISISISISNDKSITPVHIALDLQRTNKSQVIRFGIIAIEIRSYRFNHDR